MKKTKLFVSAAILAMAMMAAACGKKAETKESEKASSSEVASESTLTEDSPEIKELEALKVPAEPKLSEMGSITLPDLKSITVTVEPAQTVNQEEVDDVI